MSCSITRFGSRRGSPWMPRESAESKRWELADLRRLDFWD